MFDGTAFGPSAFHPGSILSGLWPAAAGAQAALPRLRSLVSRRRAEDRRALAALSEPLRTDRQLGLLSAKPRDRGEEFSFAVLGDAEPGRFWWARKLFNRPGVFEEHLRSIQEEPVDFSIQLGDMVSRGIARNYLKFFRTVHKVGLRKAYLTVIGNHDRRSPHHRSDCRLYRRCFGSRTNYAFDRGDARFIVVDSSAHGLTRRQLRWLDMVLKTDLRKLVFTHIPPATLHWTDFAGRRGVGGFKSGAEEFTALMTRRRVDRVFLGHIHGFGVLDHGRVRYILSGGGGSPLFPSGVSDRFYHYILVTVSGSGLKETVRALDGGGFDIPRGSVLVSR